MDIEKLKQKILDLAIRGKLVPQDPNDEPSSVLIEKIKNEKNELIKQGKIKPTKDDSYIYRGSDNCYYEKKGKNTYNISKEIPFDIPNSWIWTRLSVLTSKIQYGLNYPSKMSGKNKYLRITDIQNNQVNWENVPYVNITKDEEGFLLNNNDIVFARTGATVGKSFLVINPPIGATFASYLIRIVINDYDIAQYLYSFFQSSFYWNQIIDKAIGSTQPNCNGTKLASLLVPVPPLCEIKKINEKINMILPKIENIIKLKKDTLSLVEALKKAILSSFFDSENSTYKSYYENCLLQNYTKIIMGQSPKVVLNENIENSIEFHQGKLMFTENEISYSNKYTINPCKKTNGHSILLCVRAPVGVLNYCNREIAIGRGLCSIEPLIHLDLDYLYFWLLYLNKYFIDKSTGSTFSAITIGTIKNAPFKYCSLEIQHEIKTKISELFSSLDIIKEQII